LVVERGGEPWLVDLGPSGAGAAPFGGEPVTESIDDETAALGGTLPAGAAEVRIRVGPGYGEPLAALGDGFWAGFVTHPGGKAFDAVIDVCGADGSVLERHDVHVDLPGRPGLRRRLGDWWFMNLPGGRAERGYTTYGPGA
jgi:hypothetical protein